MYRGHRYIDSDAHVLEPSDLWERYLEPAYRERALRIKRDDRGLEYLEIDGRPSKLVRKGFPSGAGKRGPVVPKQLPNRFGQTTKERSVSTAQPGPTSFCHQPMGSSPERSPVTWVAVVRGWITRMTLSLAGESSPHDS